MSDILNPLGGRFVGPSGPVATTSVLGTVSDPPRGLRQVDPGTIIKGIVLGRESDGLTSIATDKGTVRVAANIPLPPGAQVTLEVRPAGDRLQVLILANEPAGRQAPVPATGPAPSSAAPAGTASTPPSTSTSGSAPAAGAEPRPAPSGTPPAPAPAKPDTPSIEFVGSTLRAVVVHAPPSAGTPAPQPSAAPPPTAPIPSPASASPAGQPIPLGVAPTILSSGALPTVAATTQAALIAATFEKKEKGGNTAATPAPLPAAAGQAAPREAAPREALAPYPAETVEEHVTGSPVATLALAESALSDQTRQRILALFAAAGAKPGLLPEETVPADSPATPKAAQPLPLGAELKLRVLAVQMQASQQIAIDPIAFDPQDQQGRIVFGRVVSVTPAGHAVVHTPIGDIMLQNRSSLMPGAQLALAIDTLETPPPAIAPAPVVQTPQQALLSLSQGWPTLADLVALLQGSAGSSARGTVDPETARQALALLPHVGSRLGAGLMNAMTALRAGDLGKLLGPLLAAKGASAEREEIVRRLRGEFSQLSALAQERPDVDWRALFLPVIDDRGRVTQVNLFYRRFKKNGADPATRGSGTRFVVEADFSRLGPFQLDGLMRPQRFDLMVRSRTRLTDRMRREIEAIYEEARGLTGFAGSIAFQTVDEFPVIPLDELKKGTPTYTV
ncbi:hypothetical protein [Dongia sp.]|uniref:hypothetical protein n=1 Tax=Dongia sp. TaxID=1977262 RepID=UPI0035B200F8